MVLILAICFISTLAVLVQKNSSAYSSALGVSTAAYGTWKSPITSDLIAVGGVSIAHDIEIDDENRVYWAELRSTEGGRYVISSRAPDGKIEVWTPEGYNARTRANEYGGGSFFVSGKGVIYFSNFADQQLYKQESPQTKPEPITSGPDGQKMYADGHFVDQHSVIVAVCEDHSGVSAKDDSESRNSIVSINPINKDQRILISGADFYTSPVVNSDGSKIAWTEWNHPNMPWDSTEIWCANLNTDGTAIIDSTKRKIAGGLNNSVILPKWSPDDELFFIDDRSNWWNLYKYDFATGQSINIAPKASEVGGPQWTFGVDGYAFGPRGSNLVYAFLDKDLTKINSKTLETCRIDLVGGKCEIISTNTIATSKKGELFIVTRTSCEAASLLQVHTENNKVEIIAPKHHVKVDEGYLSKPELIKFRTGNNHTAYGYYYSPKNKDYSAPDGELPPLMVRAHGGPTASASAAFNLKHQYLTSRGIAVLDVDYRGSTGYGRYYRDLLKRNWGIYDVEDVSHGALYLVESGKVDGNRLSIDGGSAGGFTTLAALTFTSVFHAGISYYGISDLEALNSDTHKFESKYLDSLIGPYPEEIQVYKDRSPIYHTEKLNSSIAFFQGGDDKIVPPSQSQKMFDAIKKKGFKTLYVLFAEEQHGFREAKNIKKSIDGELYFLSKVFGFIAPDISVDMEILNL